jgi:hypothetical protein
MTRTPDNWRYHVIKRYRNRATVFYENSKSVEEQKAWANVINWFNSIMKKNRCVTPSGAIGLKADPLIECIIREDGYLNEH